MKFISWITIMPLQAYEKYPFIKTITHDYENEPHSYTGSSVEAFELYKSEDGTRILLTAYLSRKRFNYIEFIIDVNLNKLIWHGTSSVYTFRFDVTMRYLSLKNIFIRLTNDYDLDIYIYQLIGMNHYREINLRNNDILCVKLLLKLCRLIKLVS